MANEKLIELIDRKKLFNDLADYWGIPKDWDGRIHQICEDALSAIENAPTVDAVEVVHGEWTIMDDDYLCLTTLECSVCGEQYCFEEYDEQMPPHYHYCPNCGARMTEGDGNA